MRGHGNHWGAALALELAPAATINFATAFAVASLMRQAGLAELAAAASLAAGIAAFLAAWYVLRGIGRSRRRFALPPFDASAVEAQEIEPSELLLTERLAAVTAGQQPATDELLLDDILEKLGPDSRVVRLFDPKAVPTAGELQSRIDRHLQSASPPAAPPDATQALHDALLALRQSLR